MSDGQGIRVNSADIKAFATEFEHRAAELLQQMEQMQGMIQAKHGEWVGAGFNTFDQFFQQWRGAYNQIHAVLEPAPTQLRGWADAMDAADNSLKIG